MRFTDQGHRNVSLGSSESNRSGGKKSYPLQWDNVKKPVVYSRQGLPMLQSDQRAIKKTVYTVESNKPQEPFAIQD